MTESQTSWTDEFPQVEEAFYWIRHKQNHADINVGLLRDRTLLLAEGTTHGKSRRKDFEYLPASPSDAEQLIELRKLAQTSLDLLNDVYNSRASQRFSAIGLSRIQSHIKELGNFFTLTT